jgi:NADH:ubiquinone oxidoreductase subunit 4 (subunit M)
MHREAGYRRYFSLISLLIFASDLINLSGTLDIFFAGWELIGLSSFLLIGFYWTRNTPILNSMIAFIVYRICDFGLLATSVLTHILWKNGFNFESITLSFAEHTWLLSLISFFILFASLGKSGQFPFINWLPKAFEGPTPSSAIFYGALSIHAGLLLLLKTKILWNQFLYIKILMIIIGLTTVLLTTVIEKTISNIKGQIAYASMAQIGLMYIECALGLEKILILHVFFHAILRTYQLLISPSIVAHRLRLISLIDYKPPKYTGVLSLFYKKFPALYSLTLTDYYLWPSKNFSFLFGRLFKQFFYKIKKYLNYILVPSLIIIFTAFTLFAFQSSIWDFNPLVKAKIQVLLLYFTSILTIFTLSSALMNKQTAIKAWLKIGIAIITCSLMILIIDTHVFTNVVLPHFGLIAIVWSLGYFALRKFSHLTLDKFYGLLKTNKKEGFLFLSAVIITSGMPLSPTFIEEDLVLHWIFEHSILMAALLGLSLVLFAIATAKIFTRLFLGHPEGLN